MATWGWNSFSTHDAWGQPVLYFQTTLTSGADTHTDINGFDADPAGTNHVAGFLLSLGPNQTYDSTIHRQCGDRYRC